MTEVAQIARYRASNEGETRADQDLEVHAGSILYVTNNFMVDMERGVKERRICLTRCLYAKPITNQLLQLRTGYKIQELGHGCFHPFPGSLQTSLALLTSFRSKERANSSISAALGSSSPQQGC